MGRLVAASGVVLALLTGLVARPASAVEWGADLSSWPVIAEAHSDFDAIATWSSAGGSWVRIRVFHASTQAHGSREQAFGLARAANARGLRVLLALHLSDTWADPGRQAVPRAWSGLDPTALADSVRAYVGSVTSGFAARGVAVDAVQLGNEIDPGPLLPHGAFDAGAIDLLRAATEGVPASTRVVLHFSGQDEGRVAATRLRALTASSLRFDVVALSWYPWWHGDLDALDRAVDRVREETRRPLWIVETAYPFTLGWDDATHNPVGEARHVENGPPATPAGQRAWFEALTTRVDDRVEAVFVWEPMWFAGGDPGSPWENLAWFDFARRPLPVWELMPGVPPTVEEDDR